MEGRWTIHWKGDPSHLGERLTAWMSGPGVHADDGPVPVVPCDDAAIERARVELCRLVPVCAAHPQEAWGIAEAVLRAAGKTP